MRSHKSNRFRNVVLLALVLVVLAPAAAHAQAPANNVYLPLISTGTLCDPVARSDIIFIPDPGIWITIEPANNGCPLQAYRIEDRFLYESPQGSEARWTDWSSPFSIGSRTWLPRIQDLPGNYRINIAYEVSGHNFRVRTSRW